MTSPAREEGQENRILRDGETLASVTAEFQRRVILATIESEPTMTAAAAALGITPKGLWGLRRRYGLEIIEAKERPIPDDWRQRLAP